MVGLPEYAAKNRARWTQMNAEYDQAGRAAWSSTEINWGIWRIPESRVGALGDLTQYAGKDVVELGCGTAYISAWLARLGARPVGIDVTPAQLASAKRFQTEFGLEFPLIEGNAEETGLPDSSFDLAISEYGASIWCDPHRWIPEAARLLRPGGSLVFLRNSTISMLCTPDVGMVEPALQRPQAGLCRLDWDDDQSVEFHLPAGPMIRLLRANGLAVDDLIELYAPEDAQPIRFEYMNFEWARKWPCEEIWRSTKRG